MEIRGRKVTGFIVTTAILIGMFSCVLWRVPEGLQPAVIIAFISAFMTNVMFFIGGNSLDKWIRMKGWKDEK